MSKLLVDALRAAAAVLMPFADPNPGMSRKWNGSAYIPVSSSNFDPYAAKWWTALMVIAEMLSGQEGPLPAIQKQYLERLLCGGMGSFNDFVLDESRLGMEASAANTALNSARMRIYDALRQV